MDPMPIGPVDPNEHEVELVMRYREHCRKHGWQAMPRISLPEADYARLLDGIRPGWRFVRRDEDRVHFFFHGTVWLLE